jgi:hypothetical protein
VLVQDCEPFTSSAFSEGGAIAAEAAAAGGEELPPLQYVFAVAAAKVFQTYDLDKSGTISRCELFPAIESMLGAAIAFLQALRALGSALHRSAGLLHQLLYHMHVVQICQPSFRRLGVRTLAALLHAGALYGESVAFKGDGRLAGSTVFLHAVA